MTSVVLTVGGVVTEVELLDLPCATTFGGKKRWLRCPCGAAALRLGHVDGVGLCCRRCARWKGRDRFTYSAAPLRKGQQP